MNTTLSLIRHAVGLLTRRPLETLRVVAPALVLMAGTGIIAAFAAPELLLVNAANPDLAQITVGAVSVALVFIFVLSYALMAILWHRHTLCADRAPQPMSMPLMLGYLWRVGLLAMIQLAAGLILVVPLMMATQGNDFGDGPSLQSVLLTTFVTQIVLLWLSLRLSLILPAAALGRPISITHSWRYTIRMARPLWGVAAVLALVNTTLGGVLTLLAPSSPGPALALELPIYVIEGLLIFSVLTTLYAQLIQKKRLVLL